MIARVHGVVSIGLVFVTLMIAVTTALTVSWVLSLGYLGVCALALATVLEVFCAKCTCQARCAHVIPGNLAGALGRRRQGPYTWVDLAVVALALFGLVALPQLWIWRFPVLAVGFWILNAIALVQIRVAVCRECGNVFCPARAGG